VPNVGVITIGIDPEIHLGPLILAWHGLTIALGVLAGGALAWRWLRNRGLDPEPLYTLGALLAVGSLVGGRLFYVVEHGGPLFGTRGFTFDGGFIVAGLLILGWIRYQRLDARYLDAVALGLPLGVAVGRVGDVINGEHYGARSDFFLAVRNSHPDALTPDPSFAYQNGGLYEVLLAVLVLAVIWPLRDRLPRPGDLAWLVLGLFAIGRFFEFFLRSDSPELALGLNNAQWTSLALLAVAVVGRTIVARRGAGGGDARRRPTPSHP
jgi:phosphatidylglycerol:prolipoprotein diacylglycerol transferase